MQGIPEGEGVFVMTDILQSADPGFVVLFIGCGIAILFGGFMNWWEERKHD